ncbi:DUF2326 domain-containing protein [Mameliella alba]|uniref:DUF2326 domain-containing protein n=1 Tax=Mameliella alba TaxID=561184 RepID=A0A0B3SIX9_9RHOB|nr:DUF2326 domain-containing protein [Mameliella alba]KHQ50499.1 hypothetical protein OA50_05010 [Mameliella alba]
MLVELHCEKFRKRKVEFQAGLNVVLGDEVASNSIGKSTLLMALDFIFGGDTFLEHNSDVMKELGHHDYIAVFSFDGKRYAFRRNTVTPDLVHSCGEDITAEGDPITLDQYKALLKTLYGLGDIDVTFRGLVSTFSRVWGKENLDVKQPLHNAKNQKSSECIERLIKLYGHYENIRELSASVKTLEEKKKSINSAHKQNLIPKITKTAYNENVKAVADVDREILEIKQDLAKYAVNIQEIVNREILELKVDKDSLLREKRKILPRLRRVRNDLSSSSYVKSKAFQGLAKFFPEIDLDRVSQVEEFHSKITKILKKELKERERELADQLVAIEESLVSVDEKINLALSDVENPGEIVDRVHDLSIKGDTARKENSIFELNKETAEGLKEAKALLKEEKGKASKLISDIINNKIRKLVDEVYDEYRRSPKLEIFDNSYTFTAVEDTGTGKAYSSMILLDLAILKTTSLPFLIHDSVLFKNVENEAVARLVDIYSQEAKQCFIAIDEAGKYAPHANSILYAKSVVRLSNNEQLYTKDWRT